ncbi:unnamed protein product [Acanthoscelides obtectus]|uniref:DUF4746 domain-containing protein n=1 Tax=Acanthoscelides obtectus TaxID=200917 RepID=A0A9P0KKK6_ACAOB|nr:unnamed protein product [Acanthoscelides obtectus]CAK1666743.1 hypothetical protein AOBTE_LOCUS25465 [Acanthoscelides obtectus]
MHSPPFMLKRGKMVNLMFGTDAPKLTRLIKEELRLEQLRNSGDPSIREGRAITELSDEELIRHTETEKQKAIAHMKEEEKKAKRLLERRTAEANNILENLKTYGVILILPNGREKYSEVVSEVIHEAGLTVQQSDKVKLTEDMLEEFLYFSEEKFTQKTRQDCLNGRISLALLIKRCSENLPGKIDDLVLQVVYGNGRKPPGDDRSPNQKMMTKGEDGDEENVLIGVWAPPNSHCKAYALKVLFSNLTEPYLLTNIPTVPLYIIVAYDAFKTRDIVELMEKYPGEVLSYGFFTSDVPPEAKLIAKTFTEFEERTTPVTYDEKIVIQLATNNPDCVMVFGDLGPSYISPDVDASEVDCGFFFPPDYKIVKEEVKEVKKNKKKRGKGAKQAAAAAKDQDSASIATSDTTKEQSEIDHEEIEENFSDAEEEKPTEEQDKLEEMETVEEADKATSPIEGDK